MYDSLMHEYGNDGLFEIQMNRDKIILLLKSKPEVLYQYNKKQYYFFNFFLFLFYHPIDGHRAYSSRCS